MSMTTMTWWTIIFLSSVQTCFQSCNQRQWYPRYRNPSRVTATYQCVKIQTYHLTRVTWLETCYQRQQHERKGLSQNALMPRTPRSVSPLNIRNCGMFILVHLTIAPGERDRDPSMLHNLGDHLKIHDTVPMILGMYLFRINEFWDGP
jgi:hypothetical protein